MTQSAAIERGQVPPNVLDLKAFQWIESQTPRNGQHALLSIREALCSLRENYCYLEIGSHLGGSIQPHIADQRCIKIYSIDPRPLEQPDQRWRKKYKYDGNSTQRMLDHLARVPDADLTKLTTFEASSWELSPTDIPRRIDFAYIDGEHTDSAVMRDFAALRQYLSQQSIVALDDCFVVPNAILNIRRMLRAESPDTRFLHYPNSNTIAIVFDAGGRIVSNLIQFGWVLRLPISRWHGVKLTILRVPLVGAFLRTLRQLSGPFRAGRGTAG